MRISQAGIELKRALKLGYRFGEVVFELEGQTEVVEDVSFVRLEQEGGLQLADGAVEIPFLHPCNAEVLAKTGVTREQACRSLKFFHRGISFAALQQRQPQVVVGLRTLRIKPHRVPESGDGFFNLALALQQETKTPMGVSEVGVELGRVAQRHNDSSLFAMFFLNYTQVV